MRSVSIFGSTGSVGKNTVDLIADNLSSYDVRVLTAFNNYELLARQAILLSAKTVVIGNDQHYLALKELLVDHPINVEAGQQAIINAASQSSDWVMMAIVGLAGLPPLMVALNQGACVAIANKEPLVSAGALVIEAAQKSGATILPVDSEHNAIFQVIEKRNKENINRLILTASGGPFRNHSYEEMQSVTVEQALAHPNWSMGKKISIDSASMMNKALEIIEAHHLFAVDPQKIDVLIHPQSVIHSMVEYTDGSILAQMGASDMRVPIAHTLAWPERLSKGGQKLDLTKIKNINFEEVDTKKFPAIDLAYKCLQDGAASCVTFNAANEMAVDAFLIGKIRFLDILDIIQEALSHHQKQNLDTLDAINEYDTKMRLFTESFIMEKLTQTRKTI